MTLFCCQNKESHCLVAEPMSNNKNVSFVIAVVYDLLRLKRLKDSYGMRINWFQLTSFNGQIATMKMF